MRVGRRVCWQASVYIGKREAGTARVLTATRFVCAMQEEGRGRLRWAFDVSMIKVVDGSDDVRCGGLFTPALGALTHLDDPLIVPLHQLGVARMCSSVGVHGRRYPWLLVRPRVVVLSKWAHLLALSKKDRKSVV